jgi:hypothetical protein
LWRRRFRRGIAAGGDEYSHQRGQLFVVRVTPDHLHNGRGFVGSHRGMFPCFLGGSVSRLVLSARNARVTFIRVLDGEITVSM